MEKKDLKQIEGIVNKATDNLGLMIVKSFTHTDTKIDNLELKVDKIDERLRTVETKVDRALYIDNAKLEARVKRLEEKVGISSKLSNK